MGLETGTYVSDLNTSNPVNGDPVSQGAAHLRLIKTVLQATLPDADAPIYGLRSGTAVSASGTSIDFTSIPSWVTRITVELSGVSTNGADRPLVQIGDSGGFETTGYTVVCTGGATGSSPTVSSYSNGFVVDSGSASASLTGHIVLTLINSSTNTWVGSGNLMSSSGSVSYFFLSGNKNLSATLDRIRLTTVGGTNSFDAGTVNILYE
jgi:hypothetical protein